jgi:hypothetical protein
MPSLAIARWKGKMPAKASVRPVFAKQAVKLNHFDFQKSIADLNPVLVERTAHSVLFLSHIKTAHVIPLEIVDAFARYPATSQDFLISAALNRKPLSPRQETFGNAIYQPRVHL